MNVQDVSHLLPGDPISALVPTSQAGGNQVSSNANARTAPGSQPSTPFTSFANEVIDHPAPAVQAEDHARTVITNGQEAPPASPFGQPDGSGWSESDAADILPETRGRPRITLGRWNSV
jgi:hypothetical protein